VHRLARSRLTLRIRVILIAVVGALFLGVAAQSALASLGNLGRKDEEITEILNAQRYQQDADMMHDALRADVLNALLAGTDGPEDRAIVRLQLDSHIAEFQRDLTAIQSLRRPTELRSSLNRVRALLEIYIADAQELSALAFTDRPAAIEGFPRFEDSFDELARAQAAVTEFLAQVRIQTIERVDAYERSTQHRVLIGSAAAFIGLLAIAWLLLRMTKPIKALATSAERLGAGDFSVRTAAAGIPEVDAVADAFNNTAQRLGDLVDRERSFSADVSHQLRTPLTAVRLRLETAAAGAGVVRETELHEVLSLVDRLQNTVEGLLKLAREAPRDGSPLDLPALLIATVSAWRPIAAERGRSLDVSHAERLPAVVASPVAVGQIIDVLVSNALVHGEGRVTVRVRDTGAGVAIDVEDEGRGVEGNVERIFSRRSQSAAGTGIGLALARSLAVAEGGRLIVARSGPHPTFSLMFLTSAAA
jgi:signal transduction histidine kinase